MEQDQIRTGLEIANKANERFDRLRKLRVFQESMEGALSEYQPSRNDNLRKQMERNAGWINRLEGQFNDLVNKAGRYLGPMAVGSTQAYSEYLEDQKKKFGSQ